MKPFSEYPAPILTSKFLVGGKTCGDCWHFSNGLNCGGTGNTQAKVNYCFKREKMFTETEPLMVAGLVEQPASVTFQQPKEILAGNKDELHLHALLERAEYRCECVADLCKRHPGRCETLHKAKGGNTVFLIQPKDFKKPHSMENDRVMCAPCCSANTIAKMSVPKKKRIVKENMNQQTIF